MPESSAQMLPELLQPQGCTRSLGSLFHAHHPLGQDLSHPQQTLLWQLHAFPSAPVAVSEQSTSLVLWFIQIEHLHNKVFLHPYLLPRHNIQSWNLIIFLNLTERTQIWSKELRFFKTCAVIPSLRFPNSCCSSTIRHNFLYRCNYVFCLLIPPTQPPFFIGKWATE